MTETPNNKEAQRLPPTVSPEGLQRQTVNPVNTERKDEKLMRQRSLASSLIAQYTNEQPFIGLFATLKELGIPWGTYSHWVGALDPDWHKAMEEIGRARLARIWGDTERGMLTGEGLNRVPYLQGMVNRLDPAMRERVEHSGNVSNVQVLLPKGVRRSATETPSQAGEGGQGTGQDQPDASQAETGA